LKELNIRMDTSSLYEYTCENRVHKTEKELQMIEQACLLCCHAHLSAWRRIAPGKTEM